MRFAVLTVICIHAVLFWVIIPSNLVSWYQRFGENTEFILKVLRKAKCGLLRVSKRWGKHEWPVGTAGTKSKATLLNKKRSYHSETARCIEKLASFSSRKTGQCVTPKVRIQLPDNAVDHSVNKAFKRTYLKFSWRCS